MISNYISTPNWSNKAVEILPSAWRLYRFDGEEPSPTQSYHDRAVVGIQDTQIWGYSISDLGWDCTSSFKGVMKAGSLLGFTTPA